MCTCMHACVCVSECARVCRPTRILRGKGGCHYACVKDTAPSARMSILCTGIANNFFSKMNWHDSFTVPSPYLYQSTQEV